MNIHARGDFLAVLAEAIEEFTRNGFRSEDQLQSWMRAIRVAALASLRPEKFVAEHLSDALRTIYRRLIERGEILKFHDGVGRFTLTQLQPKLRADLDRAILANAELIKLNRTQAVEKTLQRFSGWATSVPAGGSRAETRGEVKQDVKKALSQLPFVERRVAIDQGHKFAASLNRTVAEGGGAIALRWRSHWRQSGYNYRRDHKERDGKIYLLRDSWAKEKGLVKPGDAGYYDEITAVGQEPYCRCFAVYIYSLGKLPDDMLTAKGREELEKARPLHVA